MNVLRQGNPFSLDFSVTVRIPEGSEAWSDLIPELPQHATLLEASMHIEPSRQYVLLAYRGAQQRKGVIRTNGVDIPGSVWVPHERKSQQRVSLSMVQAQALLTKAYPLNKRAEVLSSVITTSEVDMSSFSPEATIHGFVSKTGKKHLIGEVDPDNSYVRTECSSSFAHGTQQVFVLRELSCVKCRKKAGLPDA